MTSLSTHPAVMSLRPSPGCTCTCLACTPNALDDPDLLMPPSSVADAYWQLYQQPKSAWAFEMEIRPFGEKW